MNNINDNPNIFVPSFEFEKKTKGFNRMLWAFVALISMFSVGVFVFCFQAMFCALFNIISTFISDHFIIVVPLFVFLCGLILFLEGYKFVNSLLHSYKFEDGNLIKGKIMDADKVSGIDLTLDSLITTYKLKNVNNSSKVMYAKTASNLIRVFNLVRLNTKKEFVSKYFDTSLYKKKVYPNARLLKETKYHLIYICDNKKLKIPKIYSGMNVKLIYSKQSSLISRIFIKSLIVFLIFSFISTCDLVIGYYNKDKQINAIKDVYKNIEYNLISYGYEPHQMNEKCYRFTKNIDDRISSLKYIFDKNGNVIDVELDIYFSATSNTEELYFIIKSMNDNFEDNDIKDFISNVDSCIHGTCSYNKLVSDKNTIRIGTSSGLIQVYN